jgi:transcriptional regulator with XRE-family HTH domain
VFKFSMEDNTTQEFLAQQIIAKKSCNDTIDLSVCNSFMHQETIHERIKKERRRLGMSLEQLAEQMNVSYQTVQQWENGKSGPKRTRLAQLAMLLGVTEQYIMTGADPQMGDMMENQAMSLFRGLSPELKDIAVQQLQVLYTAGTDGKFTKGSPFGNKLPKE